MDYVFSLYSAGHFIRAADGTAAFIVSPDTRYLMQVSHFEQIRRQSGVRAPHGYGTLQYYEKIDRSVLSLPRTDRSGRINWLVRAYPVGFYALEALWLRVLSLFTSSLIVLFFSARLLCVALMAAGLYFYYRLTCELGLPASIRLPLLLIVGLFPLTSYVSSYVQPDNLAFTLVALALYLAARLRQPNRRFANYACLGLALGALCATKTQFFIPVFAASVPLALVSFYCAQITKWVKAGAAASLFLPCAAASLLQHWISAGPAALVPANVHVGLEIAAFRSALLDGPVSTIIYVVTEARTAFIDFFISGPFVESYWGVFGWRDTPLMVVNANFENGLHATITLATVAALVLVLRLVVRNMSRLYRVARKRDWRLAFRLALSDPLFNSLVLFHIVMFGLFIASMDAFQAQGRHEYPFVFASMAVAVWYAPRSLRRRWRVPGTIAAGALVVYVIAASGYALASIHQRFYSAPPSQPITVTPDRSAVRGKAVGVLYPPYESGYVVSDGSFNFSFVRGSSLRLTGAAIDPEKHQPARVGVVLDGDRAVPTLLGNYYEGLTDQRYASSGFSATLDTAPLREGPHIITAYAATSGKHFAEVGPERVMFIIARTSGFSGAFLRMLARVPAATGSVGEVTDCGRLERRAAAASNGHLLVSGTVNPRGRSAVGAVWALMDGRRPYPGRIRPITRQRDAFEVVLDAHDIAPGSHVVTVYGVSPDSKALSRIGSSQRFSIDGKPAGRLGWLPRSVDPRCVDRVNQFYTAGEL